MPPTRGGAGHLGVPEERPLTTVPADSDGWEQGVGARMALSPYGIITNGKLVHADAPRGMRGGL